MVCSCKMLLLFMARPPACILCDGCRMPGQGEVRYLWGNMKLLLLLVLGLMLCRNPAHAAHQPPPHTAMASYEHVQFLRKAAFNIIVNARDDQAALKKYAQALETILVYLDRPEIRDLAAGDIYLKFCGFNLRLDLAETYGKLKQQDKAVKTLQEINDISWTPILLKVMKDRPGLAKMADDPRVQKILSVAAIPRQLWPSEAAYPYAATLSVEERVAGLSQFWHQVRESFVYFDNVPELDWNKVYLEYLGKVIAAGTTEEYYRVLSQLAPLLRDGHTNIYAPPELSKKLYARPPLRTAMLDNKVIIEAISSPALKARLAVGDEALSIDGIPVQDYAKQYILPLVSSSTEQDRQLRTYGYQLLAGDADRPITLGLRNMSGLERSEVIARSGHADIEKKEAFIFKMLPGRIAYLSLDHFESDEGVRKLEKVFPDILQAKALVLDIRKNGGGSTQFGADILSYLTRQPIPFSKSYVRSDNGYSRSDGADIVWKVIGGKGSEAHYSRKRVFDGPVAVLTGAATFSAAEDFLVSFDTLQRGLKIGEATGGSTGQPILVYLPGGGHGRICAKRDTYPDGREFVGIGIFPDVEVRATRESLAAGEDVVLNKAVSLLNQRKQ